MPVRQGQVKSHSVYSLDNLTYGLYLEGSRYTAPEGSARVISNFMFNDEGTLSSRPGRNNHIAAPAQIKYMKKVTLPGGVHTVIQTATSLLLYTPAGTSTQLLVLSSTDTVSAVEAQDRVLVTVNDLLYEYSGVSSGLRRADLNKPAAPTVTNSGAGTVPSGTYEYRVAYLYDNGTTGPASDPTSLTVAGNDDQITITTDAPTDPRVAAVKYYRRGQNDPTPLLINVNTNPATWASFTESSLTVPAAEAAELDIQPMPGGIMLVQGGRLYVYSKGKLYYSYPGEFRARSAFYEEIVRLPENDTVTALIPLSSGVGIFGRRNGTYLTGAPVEGGALQPLTLSDGVLNSNAWTVTPLGTIFVGTFGVWLMQAATPTLLSDGITPLVTNLADQTTTLTYWPENNMVIAADPIRTVIGKLSNQRVSWATWDLHPVSVEEYGNSIYYAEGQYVYILSGDQDQQPDSTFKPIKHSFESNPLSLGDHTITKLMRRAEVLFSGGGRTEVTLGLKPLLGDEVGVVSDTALALTTGSLWGSSKWGTAKWGGGELAVRNRLVVPSNLIGQYIIFTLTTSTTRSRSFHILTPMNFELRVKDRFGRQ